MLEIKSTIEIFDEAKDAMMIGMHKIVKPNDVTGFIYSFFFNRIFPKEPLQLSDNSFLNSLPRNSKFFKIDSREIILTNEEINYINNKLFTKKLNESYNQVFLLLDMFHRNFKDSVDTEYLIDTYKSLLIFLDTDEGNYSSGVFNSINDFHITDFKQQIFTHFFNFKETVQDKVVALSEKIATTFPSKVFTDVNYYNSFKVYTSKYIQHPYNDYSFLFKQLTDLKMMHRLTFKEATEWLYQEGYIEEKIANEFYEKGSFNTKAKSKERLLKFSIVFDK